MKKLLFTIFACSVAILAQAQKEAYNWHFGQNVSLDFSLGAPQVLPISNSLITAPAGCASISDSTGNLLFYTNGVTVWNAYKAQMPNGNNLEALPNAAQAALIVPNSPSKYYIFTVDPTIRAMVTGLKYSEVDMALNNGHGDVTNLKNQGVYEGTTEHLAGTKHFNQRDVWVMTLDQGTMVFKAYLVTPAGVSTTPVTSPSNIILRRNMDISGQMKFSPSGKKIALCVGSSGVYTFDFDPATGIVSNRSDIVPGQPFNPHYYGTEFSPSEDLLYYTDHSTIFQVDLNAGPPYSRHLLGYGRRAASLQLAPDGKIYASRPASDSLGVINDPNILGFQSNYQVQLKATSGNGLRRGLPNFLSSFFAPPAFTYSSTCSGQSVSFHLTDSTGIDSAHWNFADTLSTTNTATGFQATHAFTSSGQFTVSVTIYINGMPATYRQTIVVSEPPRVKILAQDTVACQGVVMRLRNFYPPNAFMETYHWSNSNNTIISNDPSILIGSTGWYYLQVSNGYCINKDSIYIRFQKPPVVDLGKSQVFCGSMENPVRLDATNNLPGVTYEWQDGSTDPIYWVTKPGNYEVTLKVGPCEVKGSISFYSVVLPKLELGPERTICEGSFTELKSPSNGTIWSSGDTSRTLVVTEPGWYSATLRSQDRNCSVTDSVFVSFKICVSGSDIPNIITPNRDEFNEYFYIKNVTPAEWQLEIFNRWGNRVYFSPHYENNWNGEGLSDGTYYYHLRSLVNDDEEFKGWVEIKR